MITEFSVASKTFIVGEYAALLKSPCLLINTTPRFSLELRSKQDDLLAHHDNFHSTSPAGKFLQRYYADFAHDDIQFHDPHYGRGGFGASSAQFALLYLAHQYKLKNALPQDMSSIIADYQQYAWHGLGSKPSGADVISQLNGHICYIDFEKNKTELLDWPFAELDFFLVSTQHKLPTNEHLRFVKTIERDSLASIIAHAYQALKHNDPELFVDAVNAYATALDKQGFVAATTKKLLLELKKQENVLAAKGCGALGADVILIIYATSQQHPLKNWLNIRGFNIVASKKDLSTGYQFKESHL